MMADREHFHHLLVAGGFSVRAAFVTFALINLTFAATGVILDQLGVPDAISLVLLILVGVAMVRLMYKANRVVRLLPGIRRDDRRASSRDLPA